MPVRREETPISESIQNSDVSTKILAEPELVDYFIRLINDEREKYGLSSLVLGDLEAKAGQAHAIQMAENQYMSHWNQSGYGPDIRYSMTGGTEWVQENVYSSGNDIRMVLLCLFRIGKLK